MRDPRRFSGLGVSVAAMVLVGTVVVVGLAVTNTSAELQRAPPGAETPTSTAGTPRASTDGAQDFNAPYDGEYHFVRVRWGGGSSLRRGFRGGGPLWAHDYPRADYNFLALVQEMTYVRTHREASNVLTLDDPELFRYPVAYIVEIGPWNPTEEEVAALGEYLLKGGFLIVDDFQGNRAIQNLQFQLARAVPGAQLQYVEDDHEIFDSFFRIVPDQVIPPYGRLPPLWLGVYEDNDPAKRLMVMVNANNDIAEYWEYSDMGYYPVDLSNEAYKLGINYVVYGLTH